MTATSTPSATSTPAATTTPSLTPLAQLVLGALLVVGIGVFALLAKLFNFEFAWAAIAGYAVTGVAYGVFLLESSTTIKTYWKYVAIIVLVTVGYGLTLIANSYVSGLTSFTDPVLIAGIVITVANFALNDAQQYYPFLPDDVINDITYILGGIIVAAEAVQSAPAGSIISVSTLLTVIVPVLLVYLFQRLPSPPTTTPTTSTPPVAVKT
jgi:hypothetical protein